MSGLTCLQTVSKDVRLKCCERYRILVADDELVTRDSTAPIDALKLTDLANEIMALSMPPHTGASVNVSPWNSVLLFGILPD